jgi:dsDNA-binding SOS-regulon protein
MSTYDKMMHVKELLATSATNVPYTIANNINLENISKLIAESKAKVLDLLNRQTSYFKPVISFDSLNRTLTYNAGNRHTSRLCVQQAAAADDRLFTSMVDLTNFLLYENDKCIFDLDDLDKNNVEYFSSEIDFIQKDLLDISDRVHRLKLTYKNYCENLLNLCDRKDELCEAFLNYYEEYYGEEDDDYTTVKAAADMSLSSSSSSLSSTVAKGVSTKTLALQSITSGSQSNVAKKTRAKSSRRKSSICTSGCESSDPLVDQSKKKSVTRQVTGERVKDTTSLVKHLDRERAGGSRHESENEDDLLLKEDEDEVDENRVDSSKFRNSKLVRRKSSRMYLYSIPTENRFSILSRK